MELTLLIKAFTYNGLSLVVKSLHRLYPLLRKILELSTIPESKEFNPKVLAKCYGFNKLSDIPDKKYDIFEPFGGNHLILAYTLLCFIFEEVTKQHSNSKLSWFPTLCFSSLLYSFLNHWKIFHQAQRSIISRTKSNVFTTMKISLMKYTTINYQYIRF